MDATHTPTDADFDARVMAEQENVLERNGAEFLNDEMEAEALQAALAWDRTGRPE